MRVVDRERSDARDRYGELRVIDETDDEVRLTIVDYGSAWIAGQCRGHASSGCRSDDPARPLIDGHHEPTF
jgi:hypothetical protein